MAKVFKPDQKTREKWARRNARKQGAENAQKSICTTICLESFGIGRDRYRYCQCLADMVRILRANGWKVRQVKFPSGSSLYRNYSRTTVGELRPLIRRGDFGEGTFLVRVVGHVVLLDGEGDTFVDTDSRKRDKRPVTHVFRVSRK